MTLRNPDTSMPLTLNIKVICNTTLDEIQSNVITNSTNVKTWIKKCEPNDKTLLICGSGASIAENLDLIRKMKDEGAEIWGLNNCSNWLFSKGLECDQQVIMDAQEQTNSLLGMAKGHLFASQVHPSLFELCPDAVLWHATWGNKAVDEFEGFPLHDDEYCLIGSSITVGNTSLVLAYAMGYRNMHLFGYDSSHTGTEGHVVHQAMNDGDPLSIVKFGEREFTSSLTMKLQAENFMERAYALKQGGCEIEVHGDGLLPYMYQSMSKTIDEQTKYEQMWNLPMYRVSSPAERIIDSFLEVFEPKGQIIDYGCGCGRAAVKVAKTGLNVLLLDFAENSRDEEARGLPFQMQDLSRPIPYKGDYGYCIDVMEHLPPEQVSQTIVNIMNSSPRVFWQISTVTDTMGAIIGQELHLTVMPHSWWKRQFTSMGYTVEWEECYPSESQFFVTRKE